MQAKVVNVLKALGFVLVLPVLSAPPVPGDAQTAISPQIYAQVNGYLTGSISAPIDTSIITGYAQSGSYALVTWSGNPLGSDGGGQAILSSASGAWVLLEANGGDLVAEALEADGVDAADANALKSNFATVATPTNNIQDRYSDWPEPRNGCGNGGC